VPDDKQLLIARVPVPEPGRAGATYEIGPRATGGPRVV